MDYGKQIPELYPEYMKEDIVAAIDYITQVIDEEKVILMGLIPDDNPFIHKSF